MWGESSAVVAADLIKVRDGPAEIVCEYEEVVEIDPEIPIEVEFVSEVEFPVDDSEVVGKNEEIVQSHFAVSSIEPASNRLPGGVNGLREIVDRPGSARHVFRGSRFESRPDFVPLIERPDLINEEYVVLHTGIVKSSHSCADFPGENGHPVFTGSIDTVTEDPRAPVDGYRSPRRGDRACTEGNKDRLILH